MDLEGDFRSIQMGRGRNGIKKKTSSQPKSAGRGKYETHIQPRLEYVRASARMGTPEREIAAGLQVSYSTFREYKKKHPELAQALSQGAKDANAAVENSLHKRALGYTVELKKCFKLKKPVLENGRKVGEEEVLQTGLEETHIPADTKAIIFWLTNRLPEFWRTSPDTSALDALRKPSRELLEALEKGIPSLWETPLPQGCDAKDGRDSPKKDSLRENEGQLSQGEEKNPAESHG